jgi:cobalamin biosynthesis protein CobW
MTSTTTPIPATVITGFLGAGKSTIIRNLLNRITDRRVALIINEFGDIGIDGDLLRGCGNEMCRDEDIIELANGCICCTVADDFIPTMTRLLEQSPRPDHILIETSGLALPDPLIKAFNWPEVRSRITLDGVIAVVDGAALSEGRFAADISAIKRQQQTDPSIEHEDPIQDLFEIQMSSADLIVLAKTDLMTTSQKDDVHAVLTDKAAAVPIVPCAFGRIDTDILLGVKADRNSDSNSHGSDQFGGDNAHHQDDHTHDDFENMHLILNGRQDRQTLLARLERIILEHGILRVKGFIWEPDKQMRLVVQAAGQRLNSYYDRPWVQGEARKSELVLIGRSGLNRDTISQTLDP